MRIAKLTDRICALTQLANKKYDSVSFTVRITFQQVWKQRLKVQNSIKRLWNVTFWLEF